MSDSQKGNSEGLRRLLVLGGVTSVKALDRADEMAYAALRLLHVHHPAHAIPPEHLALKEAVVAYAQAVCVRVDVDGVPS